MQANVLIVDDDRDARWILGTHIRNLGHAVVEAQNAREALGLLAVGADQSTPPIDLVITDVWMPGMSGLDLLKAIQTRYPDLPVAMISARATLSSSLEAINEGAFAYITKPFRAEEVEKVVARGLEKVAEARRRKELAEYTKRLSMLERKLTDLGEHAWGVPQEVVSELFVGLRHELGNMATAIKLNLEVINDRNLAPDELRENLDDLQATVDDLVALLARFKEYPDPGRVAEPIDLRDTISSAVDAAQGRPAPRVPIHVDLPDDELIVYGAPSELSRALLHLLENAMEAAWQTGGQVYLSARHHGESVALTISDDGPGFSKSILDRPFIPNNTTKTREGFLHGLGLGLFITRMVISLHGGEITLANRAEGGARVQILLPLARRNGVHAS
ncbi:MAG: response regulator [Anaerolineae bacterium]|nr:response regulator [Anaerolineae bacterium]